MNIDWTKLITETQIKEDISKASRITVSRTQGLLWLYRNKIVKDLDIISLIDQIEDEDLKYESQKYFEASTWDSDNPHVVYIAQAFGIEDIRQAFTEAQLI